MTPLPSPSQLLGAGQFNDWYPGQYDLLEKTLDWYDSPARFLGLSVATGLGKSLSALLLSKMTGGRTVILTATKGLQSQYLKDCAAIGGVEVKGQNNFPCILVNGLTADDGPCHDGAACAIREQCPYRVQLRAALDSKLVITNYAYWLAQTNFSTGLGDIDLLIADEGHSAFGFMEGYLTIFLSRLDLQPLGIGFPTDTDQWSSWRTWSRMSEPIAEDSLNRLEMDIKQLRSTNSLVPGSMSRAYRSTKGIVAKLERLSTVTEDWVIQKTYHGYRFIPKWVSHYTRHLFQKIPKVVVMSAILSHRSFDYLGIPSNGDRAWVEMPSHFPAANTPVWHVPTTRVNFRTDDYGTTLWATRIDQIIQRRLDRKGIVFTVSYDRARMLLSRSRFKEIMLTHDTRDVVDVIEKFKRTGAPAVLVSPSVTTGYDFPGEGKPQYIIIGKIPYPDTRDPVTKARHEEDKDWTSYLAMDTIVQSAGRCSRSVEDRTEVLVVDDNWSWFWPRYKQFAPLWFHERVRGSLSSVPDPLV